MGFSNNDLVHEPALAAELSTTALLADNLSELKAGLAKEFIALAGSLQSMAGRARQVAELSHQATGLGAKADSDRAIGTLRQILAEAEQVQSLASTSREQMNNIVSVLRQCRGPLARLAKLRSVLHVLETLFRIEGSRLLSTTVDVSTLAGEIDALAGQIERHVMGIADESGRVIEMVGDGVHKLDDMKGKEDQQAITLIGQTRSVLDLLHARAGESKAAAQNVNEQYVSIRTAIDKVVMSLQAEDIARQRLEHVEEAVHRVSAFLGNANGAEAVDVLVLQRSQVLSTRDLLTKAFASIGESLQSLRARLEQLISQTNSLSSQTGSNGNSFVTAIEEGLGAVSAVIEQYSASARIVLSTVDTVVPAVAAMTKGAKELEEIESGIQLIALNAAIKTARLGAEGAAMSVLAEQMQKGTAQCEEHTHLVLRDLRAIDEAVSSISSRGVGNSGSVLMSSDLQGVEKEIRDLVQTVASAGQEMSGRLESLLQLTSVLQEELRSACELAERTPAIDAAFDEILSNFDRILEKLGRHRDTVPAMQGGKTTADFSDLYTMQEERLVHEQVFGATESTDTANVNSDDIELF